MITETRHRIKYNHESFICVFKNLILITKDEIS